MLAKTARNRRLVAARHAGVPVTEIARLYHLSAPRVVQLLQRHAPGLVKVCRRKRAARDAEMVAAIAAGEMLKVVAARHGISIATVNNVLLRDAPELIGRRSRGVG
jgi:hypothetical protein